MNIVFFGTPEFGATILGNLVEKSLKPGLVVTPPDKPAGRKGKLTPSAVKLVAEAHGIPLLQTEHLNEAAVSQLQEIEPDLFVLASFGVILPRKVLDIPRNGTLNVHPSLLPKYRGPSPVQETILRGEKQTGVTIMLMDEKIDHGPIVAQQTLPEPIGEMNAQELKAKLAQLGGDLLIKTIPLWVAGELKAVPQNEEEATHTAILTKNDGTIDWNNKAEYIARQIRAFHPWPGTSTSWKGKQLKILKGTPEESLREYASLPVGSVIPWQKGFAVTAKQGILAVRQLQMEGKNPVLAREFLLGHKDFLDAVLK